MPGPLGSSRPVTINVAPEPRAIRLPATAPGCVGSGTGNQEPRRYQRDLDGLAQCRAAVDDHSLKISQYTYFALKSETMAASATPITSASNPDSVLVRGAERSVPALPVWHD
jgi:hypothetical protein